MMAGAQPGAPGLLLEIEGVSIAFQTDAGPRTVVHELGFTVSAGETVAIVGESGSGKSVTALAITRLIDYAGGRIAGGRIGFRGGDGPRPGLAGGNAGRVRPPRRAG